MGCLRGAKPVYLYGESKRGEAPLLNNSPSPNKILKILHNASFGEGDKGGEVKPNEGERLVLT